MKFLKVLFGVGVLAFLAAVLMGGYVLYQGFIKPLGKLTMSMAGDTATTEYEEFVTEKGGGDKIAIIDIKGVIDDSSPGVLSTSFLDDVLLALKQAEQDSKVKAVILRIDSPGGEVTASDSLYTRIKNLRKTKPVIACMTASACSGAYYAACGTTYIVANEVTTTGSIGVIMDTMNYQELMGKVGVKSLVFKSGALKDIGSGTREMTKAEQDYMQLLVMQVFEKFVSVVSEERKIGKITLREQVGDGRIISGRDALAFKLVDKTGNMDDAIAKAKEFAQISSATVVRYVAPKKFALESLVPGFSGKATHVKVELGGMSPSFRMEPNRLYLLPSGYAQ